MDIDIFKSTIINNTIFFNIQSVTEHGSIDAFKKTEPEKFDTWKKMAEKRYADEILTQLKEATVEKTILNDIYLEKACFLPELSKIITITYIIPIVEDGKLKRSIKRISGETELDLIIEFMNILNQMYIDGHNSKPSFVPIMCGHNIIGNDIPLLIKRILYYREELKKTGAYKIVPPILTHYLKCKPWDSNVIDTINVWKFNSNDFMGLNFISDFMGLKKNVVLLNKDEINKLYWNKTEDDNSSVMEKINLQSANYANVSFQIINELRQL